MLRSTTIAAAALSLALAAGTADAAACRDAKGKFVKCPTAAAVAKTVCKDAKGKFTKCGTAAPFPRR